MPETLHHEITPALGIHPIAGVTFADSANRLAGTNQTGAVTLAAGIVCRQVDTDVHYLLESTSPLVWRRLGATIQSIEWVAPVAASDGDSDYRTAPDDITVIAIGTTPVGATHTGGTLAITGGGANLLDAATVSMAGGAIGTEVSHTLATAGGVDLDAGDAIIPTVAYDGTATQAGASVAITVYYRGR